MTKEARIYSCENIVFSINGVGKTGQLQAKKEKKEKKTDHFLTPYTKIS